MAKLYFKYGAMGSSKTVMTLTTRFNYIEKGMKVWLIKPAIDVRDGKDIVRSRIGLEAKADVIKPTDNIYSLFLQLRTAGCTYDVVVADEAQFFMEEQIDELREIVDLFNVPVLCFGLRTDFQTKFFTGSKRLMEIADSISEIKTICQCGNKATVNMRIGADGYAITSGSQIQLGGNESYVSVCYRCYRDCCAKRIKMTPMH